METKFTPGPWLIKRSGATIYSIGPVSSDNYAGESWLDVQHDDLNLIAAAPDLYAACEAIERYQNLLNSGATNWLIKAYADAFESALAALAKARGEQ